ncbi:circadian clock KaiB family protein [Haliea sp.]
MAETEDRQNRPPPVILKFYVAGDGGFTRQAVANLDNLVALLPQEIEVIQEIIDVTQNPAVALELGIFSTPTLIVSSAKQNLRFVGDLSDARKVIRIIAPESDRA